MASGETTAAVAGSAPRRASLRRNVMALYVLQLANYAIPLITLPYLIRALGTEQYGVMAMAYAVVYFMVLFVDAGFNTRAVRQLSRPDVSRARIHEIYAATQWIKLFQALGMLVLLSALVATVPALKDDAAVYLLSFMLVIGSLLFPTWLFQGLEIMHFTTVCSVGGRLLTTVAIFTFVHDGADLVWAALLQASATALSGLLAMRVIGRHLGLSIVLPRRVLIREVRCALRESKALAPSEYVTEALSNSGVFILGLFAGEAAVGVYAAIEKVGRAGLNLFQPLSKALFPRIAGRWLGSAEDVVAYARAWTIRLTCLAGVAAVALWVSAPLGLGLLFGAEWVAYAHLLRLLAAWIFLAVTAALLGQFWLLARGDRLAYAGGLLAGGCTQLVAGVVGAALFGIEGMVVSLLIAEVARLIFFITALRPLRRGVRS